MGTPKDDLIDDFFFVDSPWGQLSRSEEFFQHGSVTRVWELIIQVVADEVKEGLEIGVTGMPGELFTGIVEVG